MNALGLHVHELETPALVVDIAALERNEQRMVAFLRPGISSTASPCQKSSLARPGTSADPGRCPGYLLRQSGRSRGDATRRHRQHSDNERDRAVDAPCPCCQAG